VNEALKGMIVVGFVVELVVVGAGDEDAGGADLSIAVRQQLVVVVV
jgi:hypothetical protein